MPKFRLKLFKSFFYITFFKDEEGKCILDNAAREDTKWKKKVDLLGEVIKFVN